MKLCNQHLRLHTHNRTKKKKRNCCQHLKQPRGWICTWSIFWGESKWDRGQKQTSEKESKQKYERQRQKYIAVFSDLALAPLLCLRGSPWLFLFTEISSTRLSFHTYTQYALIHQRADTEPGRRPKLVLHANATQRKRLSDAPSFIVLFPLCCPAVTDSKIPTSSASLPLSLPLLLSLSLIWHSEAAAVLWLFIRRAHAHSDTQWEWLSAVRATHMHTHTPSLILPLSAGFSLRSVSPSWSWSFKVTVLRLSPFSLLCSLCFLTLTVLYTLLNFFFQAGECEGVMERHEVKQRREGEWVGLVGGNLFVFLSGPDGGSFSFLPPNVNCPDIIHPFCWGGSLVD